MKTKYIILAAAAVMGFVSCDNAKYKFDDVTTDGRIFLNEAMGTSKSKAFVIPDGGMTVTVTPRISKPLDKDTEITVYINQESITEYNKRNETSYELLPDTNYSFEAKAVIPAGKVLSTPIPVTLSALTPDQNKTGFTYALPIAVKTDDGSIMPLESSDTYLFAANPVPYGDVPGVTRGSVIHLPLKDDVESYDLPSWTFETLFHASYLSTANGSTNTATWLASAIGWRGDNGNKVTNAGFMLRLGDTDVKLNVLNGQVSANGSRNVADKGLDSDVWHHIALVNDNRSVTLYINGEPAYTCSASQAFNSRFMPRQGIRLGGENRDIKQHVTKGVFYHYSQTRLWNIARTQEQLRNNMYAVSEDSEGLLAYWKLNSITEGTKSVYQSDTELNTGNATGLPMMDIETYFFKENTGKHPDGYIDYNPSLTTEALNFTTDKRIEIGYNWAGQKIK